MDAGIHPKGNQSPIIQPIGNPSSGMTTENPLNLLPKDVILNIFSYLAMKPTDRERCRLVSKEWKVLIDNAWKNISSTHIGAKDWFEDNINRDIFEILKQPCPFFPDKKRKETDDNYKLLQVPRIISTQESKPYMNWFEYFRSDVGGKAVLHHDIKPDNIFLTRNENENGEIEATIGDFGFASMAPRNRPEQTPNSHWKLMNKDPFQDRKEYEFPRILEAVETVEPMPINYSRSKPRLYDSKTFTRTQEETQDNPVLVGKFAPKEGLRATKDHQDSNIGVAALRKFD